MSYDLLTEKQREELHSLDVTIIILNQMIPYLDEEAWEQLRTIFRNHLIEEGVITVAVEAPSQVRIAPALDNSLSVLMKSESINNTNAMREYYNLKEELVKIYRKEMDCWRTLSTEWHRSLD